MPIRLNIPEPCHEKWSEMTPVGSSCRHCAACDRNIVDFSQKTDRELLDYIRTNSGKICGRFRPDQINRPLRAPRRTKGLGSAAMAAVLSTLLYVPPTAAQETTHQVMHQLPTPSATSDPNNPIMRVVSGKILDADSKPMEAAEVRLIYTNYVTRTDSNGLFFLKVPLVVLQAGRRQLQVYSWGFEPVFVDLPEEILNADLALLPEKTVLKEKEGEALIGIVALDHDVYDLEVKKHKPLRRFFKKLFR